MKPILFVLALVTLAHMDCAATGGQHPYATPAKTGWRYGNAPTPAASQRSLWCGSLEGGVEALFWRNSTSDFAFVVAGSDGIGTLIRNKPEYEWGVRAFLGYQMPDCWGVRISYLYFDDDFSASQAGGALFPAYTPGGTDIPLDRASTTLKDRFQEVDVTIISELYCGCLATFRAFGGARWLDFKAREAYFYVPQVGNPYEIKQRSDFIGAGPRFGVASTLYPIPCGCLKGFAVEGELGISAIIGRRSFLFAGTETFFVGNNTGIQALKQTMIVPGFESKIGVSYSLDYACFCWTVYVDYEQQLYPKIQERVPGSFGAGFPGTAFRAAGFSGFNFGLRAKY